MDIGLLIYKLPIPHKGKIRLHAWILKIRSLFSKDALQRNLATLDRHCIDLEKEIHAIVTRLLRAGEKEPMLSYLHALQAEVGPLRIEAQRFEGYPSHKSYMRELTTILTEAERLSTRLQQMEELR